MSSFLAKIGLITCQHMLEYFLILRDEQVFFMVKAGDDFIGKDFSLRQISFTIVKTCSFN